MSQKGKLWCIPKRKVVALSTQVFEACLQNSRDGNASHARAAVILPFLHFVHPGISHIVTWLSTPPTQIGTSPSGSGGDNQTSSFHSNTFGPQSAHNLPTVAAFLVSPNCL